MIRKTHYFLLILLLICTSGCGGNKPDLPGQNPSSLTVRMQFNNNNTDGKDIQSIKCSLSMKEDELEQEQWVSYHGADTTVTFEKVYPGNWNVAVSAIDSAKDSIFLGSADVSVASGEDNNAAITMIPAAASLDLTFDASPVPGIGSTYVSGRFGVYFNPSSNRGTYYDLSLKNSLLWGSINKIPEGTYAAKICVPNATSPKYTTPKFQIQLNAGKKSVIHVKPDGAVIANPRFDQWPPRPQGLNLSRQGNTIQLQWQPTAASNVTGYRVYRTNKDGFFALISALDGSCTQFSETVTSKMAYKKRIWYAISCMDSNGYESLCSESREVTF